MPVISCSSIRNGLKSISPKRLMSRSSRVRENDAFTRTVNSNSTLETVTRSGASGKAQKIVIDCADPRKKAYINDSIKKCIDKGFDLTGLKFEVSAKTDRKYNMGFPLFGRIVGKYDRYADPPTIAIWKGWSWNPFAKFPSLLVFFQKLLYRTWAKNVYSGSPSHLISHEIGHHVHAQALRAKRLAEAAPHIQLLQSVEKAVGKDLKLKNLQSALNLKGDVESAIREGEMLLAFKRQEVRMAEQRLQFANIGPTSIDLQNHLNSLKDSQNILEALTRQLEQLKPLTEDITLSKAEKTLIKKEMGHSHFLASDGSEFVAEMFAAMVGGKKFSPELMQLYRKFHGPMPSGGC